MNVAQTENLNPYEKLYNKRLPCDETDEIRSNLTGFFIELIEADRENRLNEKISNERLNNGSETEQRNYAGRKRKVGEIPLQSVSTKKER